MKKIAIICAMEEELEEIQKLIDHPVNHKFVKAGNTYYEYETAKYEIIAVVSGIGKVNAAITTQILLDNHAVDYVINVGVAGSLSRDLVFGDVVVATDLVEHDFDITAFGVPLGQIARMDTFSFKADEFLNETILKNTTLPENKIVSGRIVSGDQFIDDAKKAEFLHQQFEASACEMEGAAIAHVCYLNNVPFTVVRALSDMAGQDGAAIHSFNELKFMAASRAAVVIKHFLGSL